MSGSGTRGPRAGRTGRGIGAAVDRADPVMVGRARDLLDRAHLLFDNADGVPDDAERFRQFYLAALRAAGAALAVHEPPVPTRRRGPVNAWSRIGAVVPVLADDAEYFATFSVTRMRIESGIDRTIDVGEVGALRAAVAAFLYRVERLIIAYEQGRLGGAADVMPHTA